MDQSTDLKPSCSKRMKLSNEDSNPNENNNTPVAQKNEEDAAILPLEMIIEIFLQLDDTRDLMSCLNLSKGIKEILYTTSDFMRKFKLKLNSADHKKYIMKRGIYLKALMLECYNNEKWSLFEPLLFTPNLEELVLESKLRSRNYHTGQNRGTHTDYESCSDSDGPFKGGSDYESGGENYENIKIRKHYNLPKLQSLTITNVLRQSIKSLVTENLVKLTIFFNYKYQCFAPFIDFFCRLKHLKEINFHGTAVFRFPRREYEGNVQCKLEKINLSFRKKLQNNYNFAKFLETQAEYVEEMNLNLMLNEQEFNVIFMNFTNLNKLKLDFDRNFNFLTSNHPDWKLKCLKFYKQTYGSTINLASLKYRFPNLESFVGHKDLSVDLEHFESHSKNLKIKGVQKFINGQNQNIHLTSIDVIHLDLNELKNSKFLNLKYLKASVVICSDMEQWKIFLTGLEKIEFISLVNLEYLSIQSLEFMLSCLLELNTLKEIKLRFKDQILNIDMIKKTAKFNSLGDTERH